ncbi:hypothetical protein RhiirA4_480603 [Rhizophagus irregularis]|uniref:DNA primase/nucleoside triphosphatase C-terminal domain-containing protein n=1 Tax=Rhizophagus irregularis TaxID=588596 RepID=A0A2I1HI78_9GLOM|nr:hypothetical protein RhiirA4_480603 [Rhizophagus irregularis]
MVISNQDAPIKIDIGDSRVICFEVSARCRSNIPYFDWLGEILDHPDAPGMVMTYLLNLDLSKFSPRKISNTKMKVETMRNHLPNPIRFIINYISLWDVDKIAKLSSTSLYQHYLEWYEENGEKPLTNNILGQKFAQISIDKLHESGLGDMEEFSDISQPDLPENETADIPIFNVPETVLEGPTISQKIIPPQPEKNLRPRGKKVNKQDDSTQALFDYVIEHAKVPIASTSKTSETSNPSESNNLLRPVVKKSARRQRENCLRKRAVELGENPDVFVTITEKDRLDSITFRDRMETDSQMCGYAEKVEEDPKEYMDMTVQERLIGEEIICHSLEKDGITSSWLDTDEEWKKTVSTLQENGMLW